MRKLEFVFEFLIQWINDDCKSQYAVNGDKEVSALLDECRLDRTDNRIMKTVSIGHKSKDCNWDIQNENN